MCTKNTPSGLHFSLRSDVLAQCRQCPGVVVHRAVVKLANDGVAVAFAQAGNLLDAVLLAPAVPPEPVRPVELAGLQQLEYIGLQTKNAVTMLQDSSTASASLSRMRV